MKTYTISKAQIEQAIKALENSKEASATSLHFGVGRTQVASDISKMNEAITMLQSLLEQPQAEPISWNLAYKDSTPRLSVGNSAFENWFQAMPFATQTGIKQMCRDSYAAGMGDPLVTYATHPAPKALVTAEDISDAVLEAFFKVLWSAQSDKATVAAAVNAFNGLEGGEMMACTFRPANILTVEEV